MVPAKPAHAYIYWGQRSGWIARANLDGSGENTGFIKYLGEPESLAVGGGHIYWPALSPTREMVLADLDGSGAQTFAPLSSNQGLHGVAADAPHGVYWTDFEDPNAVLKHANLDGTGARIVAYGVGHSCGLAIAGNGDVYGSDFYGKSIWRLSGGSLDHIVAPTADNPCGVAVDAQHVYWAQGNDGTIGRANLDGSGANESFITLPGDQYPCGLAVDAQHIYWTNKTGVGGVGRANINGTGVNPGLISGAINSEPTCGLAVDGLSPSLPKLDQGKTLQAKGDTVTVKLKCPAASDCGGKATLKSAETASAKAAKQRTLAKGTYAIPAGKGKKVKLKLTPAGKELLRKLAKVKANLVLRSSDGKTRTLKVTLKG